MTTDRRSTTLQACRFPACPQVGAWRWPYCPSHYPNAAKLLRMEIDSEVRRRLGPDPERTGEAW